MWRFPPPLFRPIGDDQLIIHQNGAAFECFCRRLLAFTPRINRTGQGSNAVVNGDGNLVAVDIWTPE